ncbi:MAG: aldehyde dehydrogenase family protein [Gammaproteobacteria bacterium]|nr:MAG: aldehyde dehydrogenase family protein [Gammaproteobacteria bacterium]
MDYLKFFIDGDWVDPLEPATIDVINPATEQPFAQISAGSTADVDRAVAAARKAFVEYSQCSVEQRLALLEKIRVVYKEYFDDIAQAISDEMGAPIDLARKSQARLGAAHIKSAIKALLNFKFESIEEDMILRYEPIGVCGMITPWNWPMNQVAVKVIPALAAGCTMVLKPSEESPLDAMIFTEVLRESGVPAGVFNLVNGYGPVVGEAMSKHPGIDMMSFTGSTRGGIAVAKAAADTVKRVGQELGGKSPNIILKDAEIDEAVRDGVLYMMDNSGQSCNAPTRMLVPSNAMETAIEAARAAAESIGVDDPAKPGKHIGPVVNQVQFDKIQGLIQQGIDEGATLVTGGTGRPEHLPTGYYVKPTVFANVDNSMTIAREEIFGPVLVIIGYETEDQAVEIANDTDYGLAAYVCSSEMARARAVARRLRAGQVAINYVGGTSDTPFGGYKQSGNGREKGRWGLEEFLELKAITGSVMDQMT